MCFCKVFFVFGWMFLVFFSSRRRCTSSSMSAWVALVTQVSPSLLHPRWSQKVNGAEWSSEAWFLSVHKHLARARWPFWCSFSLLDWLTEPPPTSYPGRCLAEWDIIAMEIEAMNLAHIQTHTQTHTHTQSHGLGNETGFHEWAAAVWLDEKLSL